MIEFYIAQGISVLTALTAIVTMQMKNMKGILLGQITANLLTASTYFLLGGFSGAGICLIAIVQSVVMFFYERKEKKPHLVVILLFILLYITCSIVYFKSFIDIFSALAAVFFAVSITRTKASSSRFWYVFNPLCWVVYDVYTRAYGNLIMHAVIFLSTFVAMIRIDGVFRRKHQDATSAINPLPADKDSSVYKSDTVAPKADNENTK